MKILFVSRTPYSGGHLRMANALARRSHETRALTPATWEPEVRRLHEGRLRDGRAYWIRDKKLVDECLEWAEVVHFVYNSSLADLGRRDLLEKKTLVWHLATKWKPGFMRHFPEDDARHYRFALSCEGWDRYKLPEFEWRTLPVLFPIHEPNWQPLPWEKRERMVTMAPRITTDEWDGKPIPAPRGVPMVKEALRGLPFGVISGVGFSEAMFKKSFSWVGVDDVVNPLLHLSSFEYLSLGIPCVNRSDERLRSALGDLTGAPWPFIESDLSRLRDAIQLSLIDDDWAPYRAAEARRWIETYYSADKMAPHYEEIYR